VSGELVIGPSQVWIGAPLETVIEGGPEALSIDAETGELIAWQYVGYVEGGVIDER
jgi:hypothetical protein